MTDQRSTYKWRRDELFSLLSTSGALSGLCITVVAFMNTFNKQRASVSIIDDIFGICSAIFLLCIYLIFWALRARDGDKSMLIVKLVEGSFLLALTFMTAASFMMIYTIW
jgi:hypothetical protein